MRTAPPANLPLRQNGSRPGTPTITTPYTTAVKKHPPNPRLLPPHQAMNTFPYTYISCPCTDITSSASSLNLSSLTLNPRHSSGSVRASGNEDEENGQSERTFDPRSPRANYSLFPIEHLLFCEDCQQIRCPRCCIEEVVAWFCPGCYTESSVARVRGEGGGR